MPPERAKEKIVRFTQISQRKIGRNFKQLKKYHRQAQKIAEKARTKAQITGRKIFQYS